MSCSTEGPNSRLSDVSIRCVANDNVIMGDLSLWITHVYAQLCLFLMGVHFKYEFDVLRPHFMCATGTIFARMQGF